MLFADSMAACTAPNSMLIAIVTFARPGFPSFTLAALHLQCITLPKRSSGVLPSAATCCVQNSA
eukprot:5699942-Pyramimonas_sp.AAC.1